MEPISLAEYSKDPKILAKETPVQWVKYGVGDIHFGLELELTYDQYFENLDLLRTPNYFIPGKFVWKEELAIDSWGSELILAPQTLTLLRGKSIRSLLASLKRLGADSEDAAGCGLHVHVNKTAISDLELKRIQYFFSYNGYFIYK